MVQELPDELFILILRNLPAYDMLQCRLVSRRIHEIIDTSSDLQYILELTSTGMQDQVPGTYSALDKLRVLRRYRDAQDAFSPEYTTECFSATMPVSDTWFCHKGLLRRLGDNEIELTQFPSTIKGVLSRHWIIESEQPWSAVVDSEQDLIVTIHAEQDRMRVRCSSLATGAPHKRAETQYFYVPTPPSTTSENWETQFYIVKDKLAVHILASQDGVRVGAIISVSSWQTGALILQWDCIDLEMVSFLDEDHVIVTVNPDPTVGIPPRISVIPFGKVIGPTSFTTINFLLPASSREAEYRDIELLCEPEPGWVPQGSRGPPLFHVNQTDRIVLVRCILEYLQSRTETRECHLYLIVVASWKLLTIIQSFSENHFDVHLPWSAWGPQSTRFLPNDPNTYDNLSFGTRYVTAEEGQVVIYDFNPYALQRQYLPGSAPRSDYPPTNDAILNIPALADVYASYLPFRKIITPIKISEQETVGIDEDWLIIYDVTSGKLRSISI